VEQFRRTASLTRGRLRIDLRDLMAFFCQPSLFLFKKEPKALLKQVFRRSALREATKVGFRNPHAMMSDDGTSDTDNPLIAFRMLDFDHDSYFRRWPGIFNRTTQS
jgi:hypothetical protein